MIQNDNSTTSISFVFRLLAHAVNDSCNCLVHMHIDINLSPSVIFMRAKEKYCQLTWARKIATQYGLAIACLLSTVNVSVADGKMDLYCGPRCVQRVLDDYGYESDLLSLVKEIQWPVSSQGSRLDSLMAALESRGVYTKAIQVDKEVQFRWTSPAIFQVMQSGVSHYVVWLPPDNPAKAAKIWNPSFSGQLTAKEIRMAWTGVVLLTSRKPISSRPVVGTAQGRFSLFYTCVGFATVSFLFMVILTPSERRL